MPIYSDINQTSPTQTNFVNDLDSIYQSIQNILATRKGTRLFLPEFGSELEDLLFEPMDETTVMRIYNYIVLAIQKWEPRVSLHYGRSYVKPNYDNYTYDITLTFRVHGLDENTFYTYGGTLEKSVK